MNNIKSIIIAILFSSSACAGEYSENYSNCSSKSDGTTYSILQCIRTEMTVQSEDFKKKVEQYIKRDDSVCEIIKPYMGIINNRLNSGCEIYKNIQGDRGEIAYEQCRLDELINYKKNIINFLEMNDVG